MRRTCCRPRDTVPKQRLDRSDVCTRVGDYHSGGPRSRPSPALWVPIRWVYTKGTSRLVGESKLSYLRSPLRPGSQRTRGQMHRRGFEGYLVFGQPVGHPIPWSKRRGHQTKKDWVVGSEGCDLLCDRCEFQPPVGGKRSCCRDPKWVG